MNIYRFEMKHLAKPLAVWSLCVTGAFLILLKSMYPAMMEARPQLIIMFDNIPLRLREAIGIDIETFFTYEGFFVFAFIYIGIMVSIMAAAIALQGFSREKRGKCFDFLLTKPARRKEIFLAKYCACITSILMFNAVFIAVAAPVFLNEATEHGLRGSITLYMLAPFLTQLIFLSLGVFYAVAAKRVRSVSGISNAFGFGAFVLLVTADAFDNEMLNMLSPLNYFNPAYIFETGAFDAKLCFAGVFVCIVFLSGAYIKYSRQDVVAV